MKVLISLAVVLLLGGCMSTEVGSLYAPRAGAPAQARDIFITLDGTGNSQISRTNAARLFEFVDNYVGSRSGRTTATYYAEGVGSRGQLLGLTMGYGMAEDVKNAYSFLTETYRPGDRIYLSGFSRGAYGARILGGLIAIAGVPDLSRLDAKARRRLVDKLYDAHKTRRLAGEDAVAQNSRRLAAIHTILKRNDIAPRGDNFATPIEAMALWDTVEALAMPDRTEDPSEYVDHYLITNCNVANVYQALALDDNRAYSFTPIFASGPRMREACPGRRADTHVEEVWFAGAHADVGGSYAPGDRIDGFLPGVSLNWMLDRLRGEGLFPLGTRVFEDRLGPVHNAKAYTAAYKLMYRNYREPLSYHRVAGSPGRPRIHISAVERLLVLDTLDTTFAQCRPSGGNLLPRLRCADSIKRYGLVPELLERQCAVMTGQGVQLRAGQTCITVVCEDGSDDDFYCDDPRLMALLRPEPDGDAGGPRRD